MANSLNIYDPIKKNFCVSRSFRRASQLKRLLSFAYISAMSCCNCCMDIDDGGQKTPIDPEMDESDRCF